MKVNLRNIRGPWDAGWVLDKHMLHSEYVGDNEWGRPQFKNTRTDAGEATYQLKYKQDWSQADALADALVQHIVPKLGPIHLIIPMAPSTPRPRQPVMAVAEATAQRLNLIAFADILRKAPGPSLKNLGSRAEKIEALRGRMSLNDQINGAGPYNALIIDDLYDSGATMEVACELLRTYPKLGRINVAALTWK